LLFWLPAGTYWLNMSNSLETSSKSGDFGALFPQKSFVWVILDFLIWQLWHIFSQKPLYELYWNVFVPKWQQFARKKTPLHSTQCFTYYTGYKDTFLLRFCDHSSFALFFFDYLCWYSVHNSMTQGFTKRRICDSNRNSPYNDICLFNENTCSKSSLHD
jgi:hypothetical protein